MLAISCSSEYKWQIGLLENHSGYDGSVPLRVSDLRLPPPLLSTQRSSHVHSRDTYIQKASDGSLDEEDRVDAAVVFGVVCDLGVLCLLALPLLHSKGDVLDQTTLPPVVTIPNSLTLTSMMVPFVKTPSEVYRGDWGFFLTPMMGSWKVVLSSAIDQLCTRMGRRKVDVRCVTCALFIRFWSALLPMCPAIILLFSICGRNPAKPLVLSNRRRSSRRSSTRPRRVILSFLPGDSRRYSDSTSPRLRPRRSDGLQRRFVLERGICRTVFTKRCLHQAPLATAFRHFRPDCAERKRTHQTHGTDKSLVISSDLPVHSTSVNYQNSPPT
jgi:hypothetical protein